MIRPGLPNLHQVSTTLYRGAQPSALGMRELQRMGIRTVISLRDHHDDRDLLIATGISLERIRFSTWHAEDEDVVRFLRIVTDPSMQPVFVHCKHGSDRTGLMCAAYRMTIEGWTPEQAAQEMRRRRIRVPSAMARNLVRYVSAL